MFNYLSILILFLLGIVAFIDLKYKEIPSIFLTGMIFFILFFRFDNFQFGLLAFVLAYLLYEGSFISGIADIKMITLAGLMINSIFYFGIFVILLLILGMGLKIILKYKMKKEVDFPFIPVIFIVYVILLISPGVA